jgi:hypothetical protein
MSAMHPKATNCCGAAIVRYVPQKATFAPQQNRPLFDQLVSGALPLRMRPTGYSAGAVSSFGFVDGLSFSRIA